MSEAVLLLHGLWMRPPALHWMKRRLQAEGYLVYTPPYSSVTRSPSENAAGLLKWFLDKNQSNQAHIIGHSLGGIVGLHMLASCPDFPQGRLVTLGSPVRGSRTAQRISNIILVNQLLNKSLDQGLSGIDVPVLSMREWGMIAGNQPLGLGMLTSKLPCPHDGTVAVDETLHPAQTEHIVLAVSHTSMLFSTSVVQHSVSFLKTGHFLSSENLAR